MLNRDFNALTVNGDCDLSINNIFQGSPVTLGVNGYKLAKKGDVLAGLSFNYFNQSFNHSSLFFIFSSLSVNTQLVYTRP